MPDLFKKIREEVSKKLYPMEGEAFHTSVRDRAAGVKKQESRPENEGLLETMSPDQLERTHDLERQIERPKYHQGLKDFLQRPEVKKAYLQHREESGEKPPAPFDSWEQEFEEMYHEGRAKRPFLGGPEDSSVPKTPPQPDVTKDVPSRD